MTQVLDAQGTVVNSYTYDAFGNTLSQTEGVQNIFKYAGEQYDETLGKYYLRARYYDPANGRFTQEDTYRGDGNNLYTYVHNNPLKYVDPTGHASEGKQCDTYVSYEDPLTLAADEEFIDSLDPLLRLRYGLSNEEEIQIDSLNSDLSEIGMAGTLVL